MPLGDTSEGHRQMNKILGILIYISNPKYDIKLLKFPFNEC